MKTSAFAILVGLLAASPALAQDWGQDYNMGSIGVMGGSEADGIVVIDCAEAGNGVVEQGALSLFITPMAGVTAKAGDFDFIIGGDTITLPFKDNQGDGFFHDKTPESLDAVTALVDGLETGTALVVTQADAEVARIPLDGAAAALDGVDVCLAP